MIHFPHCTDRRKPTASRSRSQAVPIEGCRRRADWCGRLSKSEHPRTPRCRQGSSHRRMWIRSCSPRGARRSRISLSPRSQSRTAASSIRCWLLESAGCLFRSGGIFCRSRRGRTHRPLPRCLHQCRSLSESHCLEHCRSDWPSILCTSTCFPYTYCLQTESWPRFLEGRMHRQRGSRLQGRRQSCPRCILPQEGFSKSRLSSPFQWHSLPTH